MQFIKTLFHTVVKWVTDVLLLCIAELSKLPFLGEKGAIILVYGTFLLTLVSCIVLCVMFFLKKKYRISIYFLIVVLLMVAYLIALAYNIGHKAD